MKNLLRNSALLLAAVLVGFTMSCKKDKDSDAVAGFTYTVDPSNYRKVTFTNASENYESVSWNFGDASALSSEVNPVHEYPGEGSYTVVLRAVGKNSDDIDEFSQTITLTDPDKQLTAIAGNGTKSWKLLRVTSQGRWPLIVGPIAADGSTNEVWWAQGRDNDEIARRPCIMNDEWTFGRDGSFAYNSNGDFWAEGGVFDPAGECFPTDATHLTGPMGSDLTAFGDGTHAYALTATQLTLNGLGAWIGLQKIGTDTEVSTPQATTTLDILKLTDDAVDTLILESRWKFANNTSGVDDAYWRIVLVHYDDASQEPAIPGPKPTAGFSTAVDGLKVTFTNASEDATSYAWDFGDGGTSTEQNPVHTYAADGVYTVKLTSTNANGSTTAQQDVTVTSGAPMSADQLIGGAWRIRNAANSVVVGPGLGDGSWWQVPATGLDGSATGADDWSCMTDDEFIFTAGGSSASGSMQYKTNGTARNDGYMGTPQGCWTDAEIAASGNGAAFGSGTHSYEFVPADQSPSGRPIIKLTNGATGAAFIGFYKGYYGGENGDGANPPNGGSTTTQYEVISYLLQGGQEVMTVSVDISEDFSATKAWTMVLVR